MLNNGSQCLRPRYSAQSILTAAPDHLSLSCHTPRIYVGVSLLLWGRGRASSGQASVHLHTAALRTEQGH